MIRKLLCIFLMLAGAAVIAGTILLSQGRSEYADGSPVDTLILLSVVTIAAAAWNIREPYKPEISERDRVFLRIFRAVGIVVILVCLAFIIMMLFITDYYTDWMRRILLLMIISVAGIAAAALSLKVRPPIIARDIAKATVALVIAAALCFVYLNYMPKYSQEGGMNMLRSDEEFTQKDVFSVTMFGYSGSTSRLGDNEMLFGGNPFYHELYEYFCDSYSYDTDGLHDMKGYIIFNPATGAYEYTRAQEQDQTYSPGKWPEFNSVFMYDEDGEHGAVLNLYFRETFPIPEEYAYESNPMFYVSSSEWDEKIKDVIYPCNFPEDEARAFLLSIGEEALKTKLLKQINDLGSVVVLDKKEDNTVGLAIVGTKGKTVEVYFFGIDIATYQNGEIILK